jgi:hypothetical protein
MAFFLSHHQQRFEVRRHVFCKISDVENWTADYETVKDAENTGHAGKGKAGRKRLRQRRGKFHLDSRDRGQSTSSKVI